MGKRYVTAAAVVLLLLLPFAIRWLYLRATALPDSVSLASGPGGGRYEVINHSLAEALAATSQLETKIVPSVGSIENLRLLGQRRVQFALVQAGTQTMAAAESEELPPDGDLAFVANVDLEAVHFIVRRGADIHSADDLPGKRVAVGRKNSGDYAMSSVLLAHFGLDETLIEPCYFNYQQIQEEFESGSLDVAFVTASVRAPFLSKLFDTGTCDLIDLPHCDALAARHLSISPYAIPAGLYRSRTPAEPPADVQSVATRAQLITHRDTPSALVEAVARIVLSESFQKQNQLTELFTGGRSFADEKPEYAVHPGAEGLYDPELRPLLNPDFVEATEGMRSFVVSILIAGFLASRWWIKRKERNTEHKLDRYIREILQIEQQQMELDSDSQATDIDQLQVMLDQITDLRREALNEFTAHELNEDRAIDCFIEMCFALSDKINAKLSRQRIDQRFNDLVERIGGGNAGDDSVSGGA